MRPLYGGKLAIGWLPRSTNWVERNEARSSVPDVYNPLAAQFSVRALASDADNAVLLLGQTFR
jgi:hypothetical protein